MSHFVVKFMKDVLGDNGHQVETCQRAMEIDAKNEHEARALAERGFCMLERLPRWSLHADRIQVEEADFPFLSAPLLAGAPMTAYRAP
jgi:hypothetical protein